MLNDASETERRRSSSKGSDAGVSHGFRSKVSVNGLIGSAPSVPLHPADEAEGDVRAWVRGWSQWLRGEEPSSSSSRKSSQQAGRLSKASPRQSRATGMHKGSGISIVPDIPRGDQAVQSPPVPSASPTVLGGGAVSSEPRTQLRTPIHASAATVNSNVPRNDQGPSSPILGAGTVHHASVATKDTSHGESQKRSFRSRCLVLAQDFEHLESELSLAKAWNAQLQSRIQHLEGQQIREPIRQLSPKDVTGFARGVSIETAHHSSQTARGSQSSGISASNSEPLETKLQGAVAEVEPSWIAEVENILDTLEEHQDAIAPSKGSNSCQPKLSQTAAPDALETGIGEDEQSQRESQKESQKGLQQESQRESQRVSFKEVVKEAVEPLDNGMAEEDEEPPRSGSCVSFKAVMSEMAEVRVTSKTSQVTPMGSVHEEDVDEHARRRDNTQVRVRARVMKSDVVDMGKTRSTESFLPMVRLEYGARLLDDDRPRKPLRRASRDRIDWLLGTPHGRTVCFIVTAVTLILTGAVTWRLLCGNADYDNSWTHSLWLSYGVFIDPGTQTGIPASDPWLNKATVLCFSTCGFIFNFSILGLVVETVHKTLEHWHRERYCVLLTGHVLILGWTDRTLYILTELLEAHARKGRTIRIVILAERDETQMKQDIKNHFWANQSMCKYVVARRGCPFNVDDLIRVSAGSARDILVLDRQARAHDSDVEVVRVMVALQALPQGVTGRVVAEARSSEASPILEAILSNAHTETIHARLAVIHILCLMSLQPVVGDTFVSLCSFESREELYTKSLPKLGGMSFGEVVQYFSLAICVGIKIEGRGVVLAPPDDFVINEDDRLVFLATSLSALKEKKEGTSKEERKKNSKKPLIAWSHLESTFRSKSKDDEDTDDEDSIASSVSVNSFLDFDCFAENGTCNGMGTLITVVGWSEDFIEILEALDDLADPGSVIHILSERSQQQREDMLAEAVFENLLIQHHVGKRTAVEHLSALPLGLSKAIIVLADAEQGCDVDDPLPMGSKLDESAITGDSVNLCIVVTITGIMEGRFGHPVAHTSGRIVCEVRDPRTDRLLARNHELRRKASFFKSTSLETGMMAMAVSDPTTYNALLMLISPDGDHSKIQARSIREYIEDELLYNRQYSFWDLYYFVRDRDGSLLVGWNRSAKRQEQAAPAPQPKLKTQESTLFKGMQAIAGRASQAFKKRGNDDPTWRRSSDTKFAIDIDRDELLTWSSGDVLLTVCTNGMGEEI